MAHSLWCVDQYGYGYIEAMKTIAVGKFKDVCLKMLDDVAKTNTPVIITKRGKVLARLVPDHGKPRGFGKGRDSVEILCSDEDLFRLGAGEPWDAGA